MPQQDRGERPLVVFVHGYSCSWRHWADARPRLSDRYDVLLVSLPGHGTPLGRSGRLDFADCVAYIIAQVAERDRDQVLLAGHSLGGMLGITCVHQRPDLFAALILVDAFPRLRLPHPFDKSFWDGTPPVLKSRIVREMMETRRGLPDSLWESVAGFDGRPLLAEIRRPVRGFYGDRGEEDHPALAKSLREAGLGVAPDLGLHLISRAGHFVMLEQPDAFYAGLGEVLADLSAHSA
jgi:pimeloyl-ACP methyl ester carboxylesterase